MTRHTFRIAILCACKDSTYFDIQSDNYSLDIYTALRPVKLFNDNCPVIAHPPCAQWSRLKNSARIDLVEKQLAYDCWKLVRRNGGILEHPNGSQFMREFVGYSNCQRIHQSDFGFAAKKDTLLYLNKVKLQPAQLPVELPSSKVCEMSVAQRSRSTLEFNKWLCDSVYQSFCKPI